MAAGYTMVLVDKPGGLSTAPVETYLEPAFRTATRTPSTSSESAQPRA